MTPDNPYLFEPQAREIIRETREFCDREELPWPATPRYPFRVELNRFAKALTSKEEDHVDGLGQYILKSLLREQVLAQEDLFEWLATYPCLLILDGLDEVPASSNRDALVTVVNDFLAAARQVEADVFVVATSRQQGYSGEFASGLVAVRHVLPLSTVRALRYVRRYAAARFGTTDPNRAEDIVAKLRESAERQLTAQLMSTPLQVTFMVTVVAAKGDPGEDRWQLFDSYYRTIYDRERQKAVPPYDAVISKQAVTIDRLHHDIGFWLQYKGESKGGTAVSLKISQFEQLVDHYLSELGREGDEKAQMVKLITDAANNRLVFLTSRVPGELSFDVRSLQEYMAAECIMNGESEIIRARLRAIAPAPYWRNVFLFAASKCFADVHSRRLQDSVRSLCEDMNGPSDPLLHATKAGSELALDVLQSGAVSENPNHARSLARLGLALLAQPILGQESESGASADQRLASVYRETLRSVYREELELRIGQADVGRTLTSWPLLVRLIGAGADWAIELAERKWPVDPKVRMAIIRKMPTDVLSLGWLQPRITESLIGVTPREVGHLLIHKSVFEDYDRDGSISAFAKLINGRQRLRVPIRICGEEGFSTEVLSVGQSRDLFELISDLSCYNPGWLPFTLASKFLLSPTHRVLSGILIECVNGGWQPSDKAFLASLPWPLAVCLDAASSVEDLCSIAQEVGAGAMGGAANWNDIEEHWQHEGVKPEALVRTTRSNFIDILAGRYFPVSIAVRIIVDQEYSDHSVLALFNATKEAKDAAVRYFLVWYLISASSASNGILVRCVTPLELQDLCANLCDRPWWSEGCVGYPEDPGLVSAWLQFFEWLGRSEILSPYYYYPSWRKAVTSDRAWCATFQRAFLGDHFGSRSESGILRLLGRLASAGHAIDLIPGSLLEPRVFPSARMKLAVLLSRLTQLDVTEQELEQLADQAIALLDPPAEVGAEHLIFKAAEAHLERIPTIGSFLLRLRERMPPRVEHGVAECERMLRQLRQKRISDLQSGGQIQKLQLPVISFVEAE